MTASTVAVVLSVPSSLEANTIFSTVNETKRRSSSITMDDNMIDYTSMMGLEDKRRRFSEDVVDMDLKDSERLKKFYRQMQRQVHCGQGSKEALTVFLLSLRNGSSILTNQILFILKTVCSLPVLYPPSMGDKRESKSNLSEKKCI